VHRLWEDWP